MPEPKNRTITSPSKAFRASLAEALENEPDFRLAGEPDAGDLLMEMIHSASPDAIVLDPALKVLRGEELLGHTLSSEPRPVEVIANAPPDRALRDFSLDP